MPQRKSKKIFIYFFLLIIVGSINNISINKLKIEKIKKINIFGLDHMDKKILLKDINNLNLQNIFFLKTNEIKNIIETNPLIEKYEIIKKYPNSLDIKINKTEFLARINDNGETFLIGNNGKLSNKNYSKEDLPYIFGKPQINQFLEFKKIIDKSNIQYQEIKSLFYFESKRWDIKLKNNTVIKLPNNIKKETLDVVLAFLNDKKFKNSMILDARIINQIIIVNE
tara:strand:+ start:481 stop:1155 length:675 start_codon:yes stop_codon:yes gene_type:complete